MQYMHFMNNRVNEMSEKRYILALIYIENMKIPKYLDLFKCEKFPYIVQILFQFLFQLFLSFASLKSLKSCLQSWLLWIRIKK